MTSKSVIFLGGRGLFSNYGGVENAIREIVTEMSFKPINIKVYGVKGDADNSFQKPTNIISIDIPNYIYRFLGQHGYILFCVFHILMTSRPSVVVIFASGPCIFTPIFRLSGIKVITSLRAIDSARDKWGFVSRIILQSGEYCAWKYSNVFTVNSKAMIDYYINNRSDVHFIPNGAKVISSTDRGVLMKFHLVENKYFLFAARLDPVKRLHILLDAHSKFDEKDKIPLVIAGGHVKDKAYEAQLKAYSCDNVLFLGHLNSNQLDPLIKCCRAFILPSILEGMSNSLLSAMATSKAVLAADVPENRDVVMLEEGLFEKDNVEELYQKLTKLTKNVEYCKKSGEALNKILKSEYCWSSTANKFYNLIVSV
jgi:glycosyltransferase involved in cell wall biosynthesis